jgi:hypothetical protein
MNVSPSLQGDNFGEVSQNGADAAMSRVHAQAMPAAHNAVLSAALAPLGAKPWGRVADRSVPSRR